MSTSSEVRPGHNASYAIWVWSTGGTSKAVSVRLSLAYARHVNSPAFTVCPGSGSSSCWLGTLTKGRADELQAAAWVGPKAVSGEQVALTASASGSNARSYNASGSIAVVTASQGKNTTSPAPTTTVTLPAVTLPPMGGGTRGVGSGIFPTVSPGSGSGSGSSGVTFPGTRPGSSRRTRVTTDAAVLPLDPRQLGGQLAGLAVLAGGVVLAIARLSLRKPKTQNGPEDKTGQK
jgi:hypothetical protein